MLYDEEVVWTSQFEVNQGGRRLVRRNAWNEERRQAVESLMDAYGPLVLRLMYRWTGNTDAARAFYKEVFLQAYRKFIKSKRLIGGRDWTLMLCLRVVQLALNRPDRMLEWTIKYLQEVPREDLVQKLTEWKKFSKEERVKELEQEAGLPPDLLDPAALTQLRLKTSQLLYATVAQVEAEYQHNGPGWTKYGLFVMTVLALVSVTYGVYGLYKSPNKTTTAVSSTVAGAGANAQLPKALQNLPVTVVSQFPTNSTDFTAADINHMTIDKGTLYLPKLVYSADTWPSLQITTAPLSDTGKNLESVLQKSGQIDLVPPLVPPSSGKTGSSLGSLSWVVHSWDFYVTHNWGIAVVNWAGSEGQSTQVKQIYALYLPSGKAALVKSLTTKNVSANDYSVAVGSGKIVIQSGYISGNSAEVNLSLDVYTLAGNSPTHVMDSMQEIPAPFGVMLSPVITGDTIVFQGIAGQSDAANPLGATWYTLSWSGQLSSFTGPPVDGQPHWAVKGSEGNLWWVETTPDMTKKNYVELLMGQLVPPGNAQQVPAQSLSQSVHAVRVTGEYVLWLQSTDNTLQLVVTQAE